MAQQDGTAQENRPDGAMGDVIACLTSNHANTLPLVACLSVCMETMPYREAEDIIAAQPELRLSMQSAHVLVAMLIGCGGIEAIDVPEDRSADGDELQDQPCDYLLRTTAAGRGALEAFDPVERFSKLMETEPETYLQAYRVVLTQCAEGSRKAEIEQALSGNEALTNPVRVYPSYFISKLETVGGLTWDGIWKTTKQGQCMLASIR